MLSTQEIKDSGRFFAGTPRPAPGRCKVAVIWIDWYAYHVARFRGLISEPSLRGAVRGIEMVGGIGVHAGLKFREDLPADLPVETLFPQRGWKEAGQRRLAVAVWRALGRLDPEVVLVPGYYTLPGLAAALWARTHGRTSVLMTESTEADHQRTPWKERLKGGLLRLLFDWAVTGGVAHRRYLEVLGFPPDRIARFYDVVDNRGIEARSAALRACPVPPEIPQKPYFLYVGRLSPEKNVDGLLQAFLRYRDAGGDWDLVLVGDGPSGAALRAAAASSSAPESIHFMGLRGSAELPTFYAHASCFVLPSTREPWGLVVNEAMAASLPVIVSDACGCAEDLVVQGRTGLTFRSSEPDSLFRCLGLVASFSPEKLRNMGGAAREQVGRYSPESFGAEIGRIARLHGRSKLASSSEQGESNAG